MKKYYLVTITTMYDGRETTDKRPIIADEHIDPTEAANNWLDGLLSDDENETWEPTGRGFENETGDTITHVSNMIEISKTDFIILQKYL